MAVGSRAMNVGDIVQRRRHGGTLQHPVTIDSKQEIGLVIGILADQGCLPQYRVRFPSNPERPLWFESHQIRKVTASDSL